MADTRSEISRRCRGLVSAVERFGPAMERRSGDELRQLTGVFRDRLVGGATLEDLTPEVFAAAREATRRTFGVGHLDVQLSAAAALSQRTVVEVKDGEGKSFVVILSAYLHALLGGGVHVVTLSEHFARRDAGRARTILDVLGLDVGLLTAPSTQQERRDAYAADVTYGKYEEFGHDYLYGNLAYERNEGVQRGRRVAIVHEADSLLVDGAGALMTASAPGAADAALYRSFANLADKLRRGIDYEFDDAGPDWALTEEGHRRVADALGRDSLLKLENLQLMQHLEDAILAKEWYGRRGRYMVAGGSVKFTTDDPEQRAHHRIRQAVEAREGLEISDEDWVYGAVTVRDYFRLYEKLAGIGTTASVAAGELDSVYGLKVVQIPTHRPVIRVDHDDVIYDSDHARVEELIDEVTVRHATGQPVIIGVRTAAARDRVCRMLDDRGIRQAVLTSGGEIHDEVELAVMAQAGRLGAVTVIQAMAGRGLTIPLGGDPDRLAEEKLLNDGVDPAEAGPDEWGRALREARHAILPAVFAERDRVRDAGGLAVLSCERGWSRRADEWRRGLAGHRGEPGESKFFLSKEDELLWEYAGETSTVTGQRYPSLADLPRDGPAATRLVAEMERDAEAERLQRRTTAQPFAEVSNAHRGHVYAWRQGFLERHSLRQRTRRLITDVVEHYVSTAVQPPINHVALEHLWHQLNQIYPVRLTIDALVAEPGGKLTDLSAATLADRLAADARALHARREKQFGAKLMRDTERRIILAVIDHHWAEHLRQMELLYEYSGLIGPAADDSLTEHPDPLALYRCQATTLFDAMVHRIKREAVEYLYKVEPGS